jgi:serine phosphatase RsbU (regulator of sigma subunit)
MSLRAKLILSFSAVVILTWILALVLSFNRMRDSFRDELRSSLMDLAHVISFSANGDAAKAWSSDAAEKQDDWKAERQKLINIKKRLPAQVRFLYLYRPLSDTQVQMLVGGEPFEWDNDEEHKKDVTHFAPGDYSKAEMPRMHEGFERPSADDEPTYDADYQLWSLSGYAPVYDASGQKVAAVGLDYPANSIKEKERQLLILLGISSLVALVAALVVGYVLAGVISRPVLELVRATDVIAGGDLKAQVNIERKDEIGALARSFNKMVRNLRDMAAALQGYTTQAVQSKEVEVAARLQKALVPTEPLQIAGVSAAAGLRAAPFVGGSTYDYFLFGQDAYLMFAMAKVNVSGLEAAQLITLCKSGLSTMVSNLVFRPQEIVGRLNQTVAAAASQGANVGYLCGVYDLAQGWMTLANAGHAYPYVLRPSSGALMQLDKDSGPPLGSDAAAQFTDFDVKMERGDLLVAFSPYVAEIQNAAGEAFGLARLEELIRKHAALAPQAMKEAILGEVVSFHGAERALEEDLAVLVVHFDSGPAN